MRQAAGREAQANNLFETNQVTNNQEHTVWYKRSEVKVHPAHPTAGTTSQFYFLFTTHVIIRLTVHTSLAYAVHTMPTVIVCFNLCDCG